MTHLLPICTQLYISDLANYSQCYHYFYDFVQFHTVFHSFVYDVWYVSNTLNTFM